MERKNNNIIFVSYLDENKSDDIIRFEDLELARNEFNELEKSNEYRYLELGIDNVNSQIEGSYDILETYKNSNISDIIEYRWIYFYKNLKNEIREELSKWPMFEGCTQFEKRVRDVCSFLINDELPKKIENNIPLEILKYKSFTIKQLFDEDELEILSKINIDLDVQYTMNLSDEIKNNKNNIKLKNNRVVAVL